MKKVMIVLSLVFVLSAGSMNALLAKPRTDNGSFTTIYFNPDAEVDEVTAIHVIDGMFEGLLHQYPNVDGVSIAICECIVHPNKGKPGPFGNPGDLFTVTLTNVGPVGAGVGVYELSDGTGALAGIEGDGEWTYVFNMGVGTYEGDTKVKNH